jgi:polyphosphate kinase
LLKFQQRVLEEAQNPQNPLLERVKFLAIVSSNLSEFFMIRVAGLKQQIDAGVMELALDGNTPAQQLSLIQPVASKLMQDARKCFCELVDLLHSEGIHLLNYSDLDTDQKSRLRTHFEKMVFPVLTPLAFDPGRPFPHISNLSLNLAVVIEGSSGERRFARIKAPNTLPRFVRVHSGTEESGEMTYIWLEQLIAAHLDSLFPGMKIVESHAFRITRDADVLIQELEALDLLESIEESVRRRRFGTVVRVTITNTMPDPIRDLLIENLDIDTADIYRLEAPLGMSDLGKLYALDRRDLKYPPFTPSMPMNAEARPEDLFSIIRQRNVLVHHPYDSFAPVIDFINAGAQDPNVLAIKQTLYRVGTNSPIVEGLMEAARRGKQVAVLVELKARFDEESNIEWARALENEGVHVVYGLLGLKTHSKIALVVRKEGDGIRRYVHLATGNYNAVTASLYTDLGLFTCDPEIGMDSSDLFNYLTGYSSKTDYRKFLVAPINMREKIESLILREIRHQENGTPGHLIFKVNSLVDKSTIKLLYLASQSGVQIDLIVRGMCCLRPGVQGISENIQVLSVVGRFLEHSRIYYFRNGGSEEVYLGSADLMSRNLDHRVEILFPIEDKVLIRQLRNEILAIYLADTVKARRMVSDGSYISVESRPDTSPLSSQQWFINRSLVENQP